MKAWVQLLVPLLHCSCRNPACHRQCHRSQDESPWERAASRDQFPGRFPHYRNADEGVCISSQGWKALSGGSPCPQGTSHPGCRDIPSLTSSPLAPRTALGPSACSDLSPPRQMHWGRFKHQVECKCYFFPFLELTYCKEFYRYGKQTYAQGKRNGGSRPLVRMRCVCTVAEKGGTFSFSIIRAGTTSSRTGRFQGTAACTSVVTQKCHVFYIF